MNTRLITTLVTTLLLSFPFQTAVAAENDSATLQRASGAQLASAIGHYARARSLLIAAVQEFDHGLAAANPDVLIDSKEWRNTILDRAEDLEKVLAPQPGSTERGVYFNPDSRLLGEAFKR